MTPAPTADPDRRPHTDRLRAVAYWVVILVGGWWMLGQLAAVLRPLLLAVFLMYVLLPYYRRLRTRLPPALAVGLIAGATTLVLVGVVSALYASLLSFRDEVPQLRQTVGAAVRRGMESLEQSAPGVVRGGDTGRSAEDKFGDVLTEATKALVSVAGGGLVEMLTAGLYLLFLLIESDRFPRRVRAAYPEARAEQILVAAARINTAIIGYLKAKVKSSLVLAFPVWLVLTGSGVRFGLLWAVLTFLCNFIPYLGSVIAVTVPVGFAFLELGVTGAAVAAGLVLLCHVASATVIEPVLLGRAVGMSPLVILAALAVWGLLWGLPGMFLAVPLTVVLKLAAENLDATRSAARLLSGD